MLDRRQLLTAAAGAGASLAFPRVSLGAPALESLVGQLFLLGYVGSTAEAPAAQRLARQIAAGEIGGVMMLGHNVKTREGVESMTKLFRSSARQVAPFIAIDQEGGAVQRLSPKLGFNRIPSAQSVAKGMRPEEARDLYANAGREVAAAGFNMNLGPVADLHEAQNPIIGHYGRSYGPDPETVARYASAFVEGFTSAGVVCVVKHFPGHGSSREDSHKMLEDVTTRWKEAELDSFRRLTRADRAPAIMLAHLSHREFSDGTAPATLSKTAIQGLLRGKLGYDGVVMTDDLDMAAVRSRYSLDEAIIRAVAAGADIVMLSNSASPDPELPKRAADVLLRAVAEGQLSAQRIVEAHARVMRLKKKLRA